MNTRKLLWVGIVNIILIVIAFMYLSFGTALGGLTISMILVNLINIRGQQRFIIYLNNKGYESVSIATLTSILPLLYLYITTELNDKD